MNLNNSDFKYNVSNYDFILDESKIAAYPYQKRDEAKLLIYNRLTDKIITTKFYDIVNYLNKNDMLILNETKVFKARLYAIKKDSGAKIEILLLNQISDNTFNALIKPAKRVKIGTELIIEKDVLSAIIIDKNNLDNTFGIQFKVPNDTNIFELIDRFGYVPLPPYILKRRKKENKNINDEIDKNNYQTVYAKEIGSVAAPTAGFHFTNELLNQIQQKGVTIEKVTLHIGLGTFKLVETDDIRQHKMHSEKIKIKYESYLNIKNFIESKKKTNNRLICCGTTSVRTIESLDRLVFDSNLNAYVGETDLFIYDGYQFKNVDAIITNFHLPRSTLLMMISAFVGNENLKKIYQFAIENDFMFYSYGDAMFVF